MPKKKLEPIIYDDAWHKKLAEYIFNNIELLVFDPLIEASNARSDNAKTSLIEKLLREGYLRYEDGKFKGQYSAKISKEMKEVGAIFKRGYWFIHDSKLPFVFRSAIKKNQNDIKILTKKINEKLDTIIKDTPSFISGMTEDTLGLEGIARDRFNHLSKKLKDTIRKASGIQPKIDKDGIKKIRDDYLKTTELPIRKTLEIDFLTGVRKSFENFAQDTVEKLRKNLNKMILDGAPRKEIQKFIGTRLKLSKERSIFIARQETALLTTKFKKAQYEQYGIDKYEWRTMGDHKVRSRHIELNGQTIDWSNPPIVDEKTGRTAHAGEDFRCRCQAVPIVEW
jgi:SPP1 gp7 family putative phage head morphogenesis protein